MIIFLYILFLIITVAFASGFIWRWASRRRRLPCPAWLSWMLENPLTETFAGAQVTLDRIGLRPAERGLDIGCGPGRLSIPAARRVGAEGRIVALDIQPDMLAVLRERVSKLALTNISILFSDINLLEAACFS